MRGVRIPAGLLLLFLAMHLRAQEQLGALQRANALYDRYAYADAAKIYRQLAEKKNAAPNTLYLLAQCYRKMNDFPAAEQWFAKLAGHPKANRQVLADYAEVLLNNGKVDAARAQFIAAYGRNGKELQPRLAQCDSAKRWMELAPVVAVENVDRLNGPSSDWGPTSAQGLLFYSDRDSANRYSWTGNGFYRPYIAGKESNPVPVLIADPNLRGNVHIGPIAVAAQGDIGWITISTVVPKKQLPAESGLLTSERFYTRRLELFEASFKNSRWGSLKRFPWSQPGSWSLGQAALAEDGNTLYFVSDMPGGQGGLDIWFSRRTAQGWSKPVNCGKTVNTKADEAFPTWVDGKLCFSSKGHPGMGGFDLFSVQGNGTAWSVPVNLRYPLNSTCDDFWLMREAGGSGYFSSNRPGGKGMDDIYRYTPARPDTIRHPPLVDRPRAEPDPIARIPRAAVGEVIVLNTIYYDLDKWNIRPDAAAELDRLALVLAAHPALRIELSSHTDSRASGAYNYELSRKRAASAVRYLVRKGIQADRLIATGYGETRLVNGCDDGARCTKEAHQQNRRTELKVLAR